MTGHAGLLSARSVCPPRTARTPRTVQGADSGHLSACQCPPRTAMSALSCPLIRVSAPCQPDGCPSRTTGPLSRSWGRTLPPPSLFSEWAGFGWCRAEVAEHPKLFLDGLGEHVDEVV